MANLEELLEKLQLAQDVLNDAAEIISQIPLEPKKDNLMRLGEAFGNIAFIERQIYKIKPELEQADDIEPDSALSSDELTAIKRLSTEELKTVDSFIIENCKKEYRKVAMVAGTAFLHFKDIFTDLSPIFYSERIKILVSAGILESEGNLNYMRYSEIRLSSKNN
jgi:Protein of unknown function